ncbi:TPA: Rz1-like lysis system protein LysC, partial [Escherichia coli]
MKTKIFAAGTALTCLMLCAGCTSAPPALTPVIVANACP